MIPSSGTEACVSRCEEKAEDMDSATQSGAATVVIIDDEPSIVDFVQLGLRYEGFAVHSAATGSSGLELVRWVKPDLVILDIMLPELHGLGVLRRQRIEDGRDWKNSSSPSSSMASLLDALPGKRDQTLVSPG